MLFIDELRAENDARRKQLKDAETARQEQEHQAILDDARKTVQEVVDTLVREAESGEILALPQNVTMKYDPERTLWIKSLQQCAKEEGINLCIDYNFGIMEFVADPRETACARLHEAFTALNEEIAAHYESDARDIMAYVKQKMLDTVRQGTGNESSMITAVRLLEICPDADAQPNLFANWKSSLEFLQYTTAEDLLADIKSVQTADDLKAVFTTPENRCLHAGQSLTKMVYALWRQAEEMGISLIPAGEWMPFANMKVSIVLLNAEL